MRDPRAAMARVARGLAQAGVDEVVFVGGATVGLLLTDKAAPPPRVTLDVDVIVEAYSYAEYASLEANLRAAGFTQPTTGPICRWIIDGIEVDIMPVDEAILGFSNRWYQEIFRAAHQEQLADDLSIAIVTAPYFLATKFEAYASRGEGDYWMSPDMTDIVAVVDGRPELVEEVRSSPQHLQQFLAAEVRRLLGDDDVAAAVEGHLPPGNPGRVEVVMERLRAIAGLVEETT